MTRYRVSWSGVARRRFAVERPADVLYLLWTQHREDMVPGLVTFDAAGEVAFPASLSAVVEAADVREAAQALRDGHPLFEMGGDVTVEEVPS